MAKLPSRLPKWATTVYLGDDIAWDEAKRQSREALYEWAAAREPHIYTDLSNRVTALPWPDGPHTHEGNQMGYLLGQVSLGELSADEDRPLISALVIDKALNMPSTGFWEFCQELGLGVAPSPVAREAFWLKELNRCFAAYGTRGGTE